MDYGRLFNIAVQSRGRYRSETGDSRTYPRRPRRDLRAGVLGISYGGFTSIRASHDPHPALKAVSPQATCADMFIGDDWHHNGAFRLEYAFNWIARVEGAAGLSVGAVSHSDHAAGTEVGRGGLGYEGSPVARSKLPAQPIRGCASMGLLWSYNKTPQGVVRQPQARMPP